MKPLFDPAAFYNDFFDETVIQKRMEELKELGMDEEIQSKRGWIGYELPDCSWSESWHPSLDVSNYRCWPAESKGWILQIVDGSGNHTCMLRRKAVREMPTDEWNKLIEVIRKMKEDYPMLCDSTHSDVESEYQDKEWEETYREEFQKALSAKFQGVFTTMQHSDRIEEKFYDLVNSKNLTDSFFFNWMRNAQGEEWTEARDGDWSLDVDGIVDRIDTHDIVDFVYPEDPRQLKFKFMQAEAIVRKMLADDLMVMIESPLAHRIVDSLLEDSGPHSKSCVMVNLPEEMANQVMAWGKLQVKDEDIFVDKKGGMGREDEPHVTVLYGLLDEKPTDTVLQVFEHTAPFEIKLGPCSLFKNDDNYDVLKMEVLSPFLHALNRNICSVAAYENDYPDYRPHVTIAYVKPGTCDRLEGASPWDDPVKLGVTQLGQDGSFTAKTVIYSSMSGNKTEYTLGTDKKIAQAVNEVSFIHGYNRFQNLFGAAHGRMSNNEGEFRAWLNAMQREYEVDTGKPVMGKCAYAVDFLEWLESSVSIAAASKEWEPGVFESIVGRKPETDGELQKWVRDASQAHFRATGKVSGLRAWLEAEMSDDEMASFVAGSGALDVKKEVSHRTIRRIIGGHIVDKVEIWRGNDDPNRPEYPRNPPREGNIRITYRSSGRADSPRETWEDGWCSYGVLKWALRNWRNLYGATLFVDGQEAGTVSYRNPALAE
ncbi:MAG: 2'-5' RNA ligase family protein [Azonexus sp.]